MGTIEFALYGRVRRKQPNKFKPFMSKQSSDKPLLNTDAYNEGNSDFAVEIFFSHEEGQYRLLKIRIYQQKSRETLSFDNTTRT